MHVLPTSVRTRLTLWYTILLAVPLTAFAITSYLIFSETVRARTDAFVSDALTVFGRELQAERRRGPTTQAAIERTLTEMRFREMDVVILDDSGTVVGRSAPLVGPVTRSDFPPAVDPTRIAGRIGTLALGVSRTETVHLGGRAFLVEVRPVVLAGLRLHLVGVHSLQRVDAMLRTIRHLFLVVIPLIIVCAAAGGFFLARRSFRPVSAMAARAAEIGASTLHDRLPVATNDELGELARVLNDLLDRLESAFEQQRRFMTDASHELRTPTAIVRTEADVTLSRESRSEEEYRASMAIVRDASRRLTRIVEDVFLIARADAGYLVTNPEPLYLEDLVRETVRAVTPIAHGRSVSVELGEMAEAPLVGDADLLNRLILNLLDNAIKYSPAGGTIQVSMQLRGSTCDVSVVDAGPGIPPEAQERVFERFFRVDAARSRAQGTLTSGAGLGLSICRRIAEMHGGRLVLVGSRPGRTEFRVSLPFGSSMPAPTGAVR